MSSSASQAHGMLPRTSRLALVAAVVVGALGLALHQPLVVVSVLAGVGLGIGVTGFAGSLRRIWLAAVVLPLALVTVVVAIGASLVGVTTVADLTADASSNGGLAVGAGSIALLGAVLGLSLVGTTTAKLSETTLSKASASALAGTLVGTALVGLVSTLATGGIVESLTTLAFAAGPGFAGFAGTLLVVAAAVVAAGFAVPDAALTSPGGREYVALRRRQFAVLLAVVTVTVLVLVALAQQVGSAVTGVDGVVSAVVDSLMMRAVLVTVGSAGLLVTAFSLVLAWSWNRTETDRNDDAVILAGTVCGVSLVLLASVLLPVPNQVVFLVPVLLLVSAVGLYGLRWALDTFGGKATGGETVVGTVAVALLAGGIAVGATTGDTATVGRSELGSLLAVGAGVFAYAVGTYGDRLRREVGVEGTGRTPQLVQVSFAGTVVAGGAVVVVLGFPVAMYAAPTLSISATVGLVGALLATVFLVQLLFE